MLVKTEDGGAAVLAGGAGRDRDHHFREIIHAAPSLIQDWANDIMAKRTGAPLPKKEDMHR
jgi:hypothetical protein